MPSWDQHDDFDPDVIERPPPYTADEWAETEGARENQFDGPSDFRERALDAGYDPADPKAISLEMDGLL